MFEFDDWGMGLPDTEGKLLFDHSCGAVSFGRAIYNGTGEGQGGSEQDRLGAILSQFKHD